MVVTAYPVAGKRKSQEICLAFVRGCGGQIGTGLREGAAVFYGVDQSNIHIWREVCASGRDYFYIDNSVFDTNRQKCFRVTRNGLQHNGAGASDGRRFAALGVEIKPWRERGEHIVLCPQSPAFMKTIVGYVGNWLDDARADAEMFAPRRELRVREWSANKGALAATLSQDLARAHALATWSSAAAVTAVLAGVPVIVGGQDCAAASMAGAWHDVEALPQSDDRERWAGVLADNEFTLDEMRAGMAWRHLNSNF